MDAVTDTIIYWETGWTISEVNSDLFILGPRYSMLYTFGENSANGWNERQPKLLSAAVARSNFKYFAE